MTAVYKSASPHSFAVFFLLLRVVLRVGMFGLSSKSIKYFRSETQKTLHFLKARHPAVRPRSETTNDDDKYFGCPAAGGPAPLLSGGVR